jgi:hypothetical protein
MLPVDGKFYASSPRVR